jgi:hypothetical protein
LVLEVGVEVGRTDFLAPPDLMIGKAAVAEQPAYGPLGHVERFSNFGN